MSEPPLTLFWFRRDLRSNDNHGLYRALVDAPPVLPLFIFDSTILGRLEDKNDRRVSFIHDRLRRLHGELQAVGSTLLVEQGEPRDVIGRLIDQRRVKAVYANHDHEPYACRRDEQVRELLNARGIIFRTFKDQTVFDRDEVMKDDGNPYTVFTPYSRRWRARLAEEDLPSFPSEKHTGAFLRSAPLPMPGLSELGFMYSPYHIVSEPPPAALLKSYASERNRPASEQGSTGIGVHLRFGTVSVREMVRLAMAHSDTWLNELIWREFFMQVLWHFPHVERSAFRPAYDRIPWRDDEAGFAAWCEGRTGYPLVDAGMRQLRATGTMHNRVRMVVASFLTKHLMIDWRWGEAWFARWLMDFELASNNGNWQWAAGSGCDAAPYFRIFNPQAQLERFDPRMEYVLSWAPEYSGLGFPRPIVDHAMARERALKVYAQAVRGEK